MTTKQKPKQYSDEFKEEAIALITDQNYSVSEAANSLGVRTNLLYRWKQEQADKKSGLRLSSEERAELNQLRRDIKKLKMEKEILKKASAFFASEMK